ncbi:SusC/RagA family TonB-linked outer membrane protein [Flavobacterium sp.]|uniref:SusC/RagA family TonB-linked outer membrane protein n=1 Tax=Flavobacterium sp. TaxID=239 RepID=UPI002FDB8044
MNKFSLNQRAKLFRYLGLLSWLLYSVSTLAQQQPQQLITGTVSDAQGSLPGVTVSIKGKASGTLTNENGQFSINATPSDVLVFSYMGYKTQEITIGNQNGFQILLLEDTTQLKEVVVNAGYYSVKDKERTGSIGRITAKEIETQPITNLVGTLQGRLAGVNIVQESGIAGGGFQINVRGVNSLRTGANNPLYIIDGVPYSSDPISDRQTSTSIPGDGNPLASINPNDIESIEILKDADATAIYGSRGANGVVLISTKRGKSGATSVTVETNHSFGSVTRMMKLMNTEQYLKMRREAFANDNITTYPANAFDINGTWDQTRYTDWQKVLIGGTAQTNFWQASVSGGTQQSNFLFSGNYRTETSVFPGDFLYKKGGARVNYNYNSKDNRFQFNFSASYMAQDNNLPWIDYVTLARNLAPNAPALHDSQGNLNWENSTWENPLANSESKSLINTTDLISNAVLTYKIANNLTVKSNLGFTDLKNNDSRSLPSTMYNPAFNLTSQQSSIYWNNFTRNSWIVEPQINWVKNYGKSSFNALAGASYQSQKSEKTATLSAIFSSNSLLYNQAAAAQNIIYNNDEIEYKYQAFFGRLNYDYDKRFIINLTGRRDGSSRFGPGKQFATFGAVGAAWLFSNETFVQNKLPFLSFGKLRSSYGTTGSDQIGDYQFLNTYSNSSFQYAGTIGLQPARLYNPNFSWETNKKWEASLEIGLLNDRIFLTTAYYINRSSNQLVGLPLPGTTGFPSIQENLNAVVENRGWETTLRVIPFKTDNFSWIANINFTKAGNKLISFPGLENSSFRTQYVVGQPTTIRKLFNFTGVDPQTGLYQFQDVNGDGIISFEYDRETVRDFNPDFYGGLHNLITYKKFQLDFLFQFVKQENFNFANTKRNAGHFTNQPVAYLNSWSQVGDNAPYQLYGTTANQTATQRSEFFSLSNGAVSDASFIRLKNIALTYEIPKKVLKDLTCRVSLQGQNIVTITSYQGADPEFTLGGTLPPLRIYAMGLQLIF